ncbi:hypothetical protein Tco_0899521 [Tanacetum coccineum]
MSNMSEDIEYAGSDTRPLMLDRTDFDSWQQRIRLYCLGKDNGENIMKSITEGLFQMGIVIQTVAKETEGALQLGPERARVFIDLIAEEKERYKDDICATNILLQCIPKDIYTLINHYTDAKDIWDNVKIILEGSELTKDDRESQLYDEFERFLQIKGETTHDQSTSTVVTISFESKIMNPQETEQVIARDELWVHTAERINISTTNVTLEITVKQKEETFQVVIDVIKNSTCFKAFTISVDVPEILMQQFWSTSQVYKYVCGLHASALEDSDSLHQQVSIWKDS